MAVPLGLAVAAGRPAEGILAGLGAMFAGVNDRPGGRRGGAVQQAVPALGGALGLLIGIATGWWAVPLLGAVGLLCGAISVAGPVASATAVQLLVLTALGCGMPVPLPGWAKAACYLSGAGWLLLLRQLTTHPRPRHAERHAVAAVFDALADALDAAGTDRAETARRQLTAALDRAGESLRSGWAGADGASGGAGQVVGGSGGGRSSGGVGWAGSDEVSGGGRSSGGVGWAELCGASGGAGQVVGGSGGGRSSGGVGWPGSDEVPGGVDRAVGWSGGGRSSWDAGQVGPDEASGGAGAAGSGEVAGGGRGWWAFEGRGRVDALRVRLAAASALCEAGVALLHDGRPLPGRLADGPRRLAEAVRADRLPGPLPVPAVSTPATAAFDRAVLHAALAFGTPADGTAPVTAVARRALAARVLGPARRQARTGGERAGADGPSGAVAVPRREGAVEEPSGVAAWWRRVSAGKGDGAGGEAGAVPGVRPWGRAGVAGGVRVAVCVGVSAVVALSLRTGHWYWLPVTAAFLVKPDYGPLFSRVVNRFVGTVAGVLLVGGLLPVLPAPWWPVGAVGVAGALIPVAQRHFAAQTAVITVTVLAFVTVGGDRGAAAGRLVDTALACVLVLLVGHLPGLADTRARVGQRAAHALRHTQRYLDHVLSERPDGAAARRTELRRAAYRTLAQARAAAETAAAELQPGGPPGPDWLRLTVHAERLADAATAYAVERDHGTPAPAATTARRLTGTLAAAADALERPGPYGRPGTGPAPVPAGGADDALADVRAEVRRIQALTAPARPGRPPATLDRTRRPARTTVPG
ncbi:FUSC family protein [Kitasatospora sp. NPDC088134]|uniref:FUSC family protein n=1 Tax=Kitasatospora sp. NPDC088134 TaxID=3364071 RepID=UPI0038281952